VLDVYPDVDGTTETKWLGGAELTGSTIRFQPRAGTDHGDMTGTVVWFNDNTKVGHVKIGTVDMTVAEMDQALHLDTVYTATVDDTDEDHPDLILTL
jgi:hypothetical protein